MNRFAMSFILMRASARTSFESGGCAAAPFFTKHIPVLRPSGRPLRGRSNSLQANLVFACPKERRQRKGHPANAACGFSALIVPARRSPTRCAQTRLACLLSGTAMLDALGGNPIVDYSRSIAIQTLSLRRSASDCGNLNLEIATPCYARFAMTKEINEDRKSYFRGSESI